MSTFIIRNKSTLQQWVAKSGKRSWNKPNHAKAAFAHDRYHTKNDPLLTKYYDDITGEYTSLKFNDQDVYEIVELYSDVDKRAAKHERVLKEIIETLYGQNLYISNWHMNGDLEPLDNFFEGNGWFLED